MSRKWGIVCLQGFVTIVCVWLTLSLWGAAGSESAKFQSRPEHFSDDAVATLAYFAIYMLTSRVILKKHVARELLGVVAAVCTFAFILGGGVLLQTGNVVQTSRSQFMVSSMGQILFWSTIEGTALILGLAVATAMRRQNAA